MSTLALRGRIAELEKKKTDISIRISALVKAIEDRCRMAHIVVPEHIDADQIASLAGSLAEQRREYKETLDMIREIEREL